MQLKINNRVIDKFIDFTLSLRYDSVASAFSANIYFDPANNDDRQTFFPGNYYQCEISHNGELLLTGVALTCSFISEPATKPITIGGYSRAGVIEDSQNPLGYQSQFIGSSIKQICQKIIAPFGLNVIVDDAVNAEANATYDTSPAIEPDTTIKEFLTTLALGKNLLFSHDAKGNLLLTRADVNKEPIFSFGIGEPCLSKTLTFNGQGMHNKIFSVAQITQDTDNASQDEIDNPYVISRPQLSTAGTTYGLPAYAYDSGYRPGVYLQKSGNNNITQLTTRQYLSQELKNIKFLIKINTWELNGKLVRPNNVITVIDPNIFLYQKTKLFIESVDFHISSNEQTAVLTCVVPECYTNGNVVNIFTGSNLTVPYSETGAKAVITPFDQP